MIKPEKMALVTFAGPKTVMQNVINALYDMGILHIEEGALNAAESEGFDLGEPIVGASEIAGVLVRTRSAMSRLGIDGKKAPAEAAKKPLDAPALAAKKLSAVEAKILEMTEEQKKIDEETSRISALVSELAPLAPLGLDVSSYAGYKSLAVFVGFVGKTSGLKEKVSSSSKSSEVYLAQHHGKPIATVFCDAGSADAVRKILSDYGFGEISTKNAQALRGKPANLIAGFSEKLSGLRAERARLNERIAKLGRDCSVYLTSHASKFEVESEKLDAPLKFAASKNAFIASGWIPEKNYGTFEARLRAASDDKIFVAKNEGKFEDAPVELANPRAVAPYQFFLDMYSLPKYTEIDPTFFMFLTFPFFFGFMLGDIGYGLVTLLLFLVLRTRMPALRDLLTVMSFSSLAAIIFGLAYGEFFGLEKIGEFELPNILHRATEANELFMAAVAVGALHVTVGFMLGFYNVLRMHGFWHALFEKGSWLVLEAGAVVAALPGLGYTIVPAYYGYALLGIAVLMLLKGEGVRGVLELPSLLANILSYARLMAVGLVSVILAVVVNENAAELFHAGPVGIIAAIVILVAGHGINIALGLLSPFIHSMRLHYVEFFLKFYHGGGKRYMPFGLKRNR